MSKSSSENEQAYSRILDMIRMIGIVILLFHFYYYGYAAFAQWGMTKPFVDSFLRSVAHSGLFSTFNESKIIAIVLLVLSLIGARGKKEPRLTPGAGLRSIGLGLFLYFASGMLIYLDFPITHIALLYMAITITGFLLVLSGGNYLSRLVFRRLPADTFNRLNASFPQEERLLENEYSWNLPAEYQLKNSVRKSWINNINPFRGTLILGSPGSGKTWFLIQPIIRQQIQKGFSMLIYDFKYDDLSRLAYNYFLKYRHIYPGTPGYYNINFDDLNRSHRCNPLPPSAMVDSSDARESARTLLLGLNMDWIPKQGDFFVISPVNFVTALVWFLRSYQGGRYCTWPHVIELSQIPYKELFSVLRAEPQCQVQIVPFVNALLHGAAEQLEGQIASATISLATLSSPALYYVLTGDDFTLDLNNPEYPKILTLGNNPQKTATYGAVLSVYINTINRLANKKGLYPLSQVLDEFSTIIANSIDKTIATGRSNRIAITLCVQDSSQLRLAYGKEYADVILNLCGNIISGQVSGDTANLLSDRFGRTMQDRESVSINTADVNITQSSQLELAIPASRIASLSSGEFVGLVTDNPDQHIELKTFCCRALNDQKALKKEEASYKELPIIREVTEKMLMENYLQIKKDTALIIQDELFRIRNSPELRHLIIE